MKITDDVLTTAAERYDALIDSLQSCGDGGCVIRKPKGMHTNGGCRCYRDSMKMQRVAYAAQELRKAVDQYLKEKHHG
ncbi:hypothetical protein [Burkholderia multivorans]|uniref:hypothetical protein n=1 Tax=Burkholderia multivorans TaxID=87883 RepID=UPI001C24CB55|nr:hypothetical protein [Burkholderia multivorans]MBU9262014.1 hypothetical protein [Burkholderia multivorans]